MKWVHSLARGIRTMWTIGGACAYVHSKQKQYKHTQERKKAKHADDAVLKAVQAVFFDKWMVVYDHKKKVFVTGEKNDLCVNNIRTLPLKEAYQVAMDSGDEELISKMMEFPDFRKLHRNLDKELRAVYENGQIKFVIAR